MAEGQERARSSGKGRRWLGRAVGLAILVAVGAIVVPNLWRAGQVQPSGAVANLRTMNTALIAYTSYNNGFPATLEWLAAPPDGQKADCNAAAMLEPLLAVANPQKQGFNYTYKPAGERVSEPATGCSQAGYWGYTLSARPLRYRAGWRSYFTDETGVFRWTNKDRAATAEDPTL